MLLDIRERATGWIAYLIIGALAFVFALWGIQGYMGGSSKRVAAKVNGTEISMRDFSQQLQRQRDVLRSRLGDRASQISDSVLKQNVIQQMIRTELLRQEADSAGYRIGDQMLVSRLKQIPAFQTDGRFNRQRYDRLLQAQRRSKSGFERRLRQQMKVSQLESGVRASAFVPKGDYQQYLQLKNETRKLRYVTLGASQYRQPGAISAKQIKDYYQAHEQQFRTPARVKLAYVDLNTKALRQKVTVDESKLHALYQQQQARYKTPEQRKARHILIEPQGDAQPGDDSAASDKVQDKAMEKARMLVAKLRAGGDFKALAKQYSDDQVSASSGGELGFLARGDMSTQKFEDALFALGQGKISDPIPTSRGVEIIQVENIKAAGQKPFKAVRGQLAAQYKRRIAHKRYVDRAQQLITMTYEQSGTLAPAADALGLQIQHTDWITKQSNSGIAANEKVRAAAFSPAVLNEHRNSEVIELDDGRSVVVRAQQYRPAAAKPLKAVKAQIRERLVKRQAEEQAAKRGQQFIDQLREQDASLADLAGQTNTQVKAPGFVGRSQTGKDGAAATILDQLFKMPKPAKDQASYAGQRLANGDYAVIALEGVKPGDSSGLDVDQLSRQLHYGQREAQAAMQSLENSADIQVMKDNL